MWTTSTNFLLEALVLETTVYPQLSSKSPGFTSVFALGSAQYLNAQDKTVQKTTLLPLWRQLNATAMTLLYSETLNNLNRGFEHKRQSLNGLDWTDISMLECQTTLQLPGTLTGLPWAGVPFFKLGSLPPVSSS